MNNEPIEGMVPAADGLHAVMIDSKNAHFGWVFVKHPSGTWVSAREASEAEIEAAVLQDALSITIRAHSSPQKGFSNAACAHEFAGRPPPTPEDEARLNTSLDKIFKRPSDAALDDVLADHNRLVRELDVLLNGEAGAADQASLCDIVAQVRMARKKSGTGALQLLALVPDQVVGRVHRVEDVPDQAYVALNSCGRALPDSAPLYARPADTLLRYVRAPSRKDPKYHEEWPEIEGGPVFDGVTYCNDLFEALKRYNVIVAETLPECEADESSAG